MYILCFLLRGTLPIIQYINENIEHFNMDRFLAKVLDHRKDKMEENEAEVKKLLPNNLRSAFAYICSLKHKEKPDYNMVKLWLAYNRQDERNVFATEIQIQNLAISRDLLYDQDKLRVASVGIN